MKYCPRGAMVKWLEGLLVDQNFLVFDPNSIRIAFLFLRYLLLMQVGKTKNQKI